MHHHRTAFAVCISIFTIFGLISPLWSVDLASLQDPRPTARILDQAAMLGDGDRQRLEATIERIASADTGELMVVTIDTTNGADLRQSGTALFNRWRIGTTGRDNGTLLVIAMTDRRCEIILGDDVDSDTQVSASQRIFDDEMKPRLRAGDPGDALVCGAEAIARSIYHLSGATETPARADSLAVEAGATDPVTAQHSQSNQPSAIPHRVTPTPYAPAETGWSWGWWLGGIGGACASLLGGRAWLRYRQRRCTQCRMPMQRLGEVADDAHLTSGQRAEEQVGSVDYDVWACMSCNQVVTLRWGTLFSAYSRCPGCQAKTKRSRSTTISAATYSSGGLVRVDETCTHCQWSNTYTRSTPRLQRSSSGRGFGGSGGFGGGGGGRSSGRGGGGSW